MDEVGHMSIAGYFVYFLKLFPLQGIRTHCRNTKQPQIVSSKQTDPKLPIILFIPNLNKTLNPKLLVEQTKPKLKMMAQVENMDHQYQYQKQKEGNN